MIKFRIGTFLKILTLAAATRVSQPKMYHAVFLSVSEDGGFDDSSKIASSVINHRKNVPPREIEAAKSADTDVVISHFENVVLPLISGIKLPLAISAIIDLIKNDKTIHPDTELKALCSPSEYDPAVFLARVFLLCVQEDNEIKDKDNFIGLEKDFLEKFEEFAKTLTFIKKTAKHLLKHKTNGVTLERVENTNDPYLHWFITVQEGICLCCTTKLASRPIGAIPFNNWIATLPFRGSKVVALLCSSCATKSQNWTETEIEGKCQRIETLEKRFDLENVINNIPLPKGIEHIVSSIAKDRNLSNLPIVDIGELKEIERKIYEPTLRHDINSDMTRMFVTIHGICSDLAGENIYNDLTFRSAVGYMYATAKQEVESDKEVKNPQERIFDILKNRFSVQPDGSYDKEARMLVSYLVKMCDIFNENTK